MATQIENDYRRWLTDLACKLCEDYGSYRHLFEFLYSKTFYAVMRSDENRALDGKDMRFRFAESVSDYDYRSIYLHLESKPCNILEMMIALAFRCEEQIMWDPELGDRTGMIFYQMICNLRLDDMTDYRFDRHDSDRVIDDFIERRYAPNGDGGLFIVNNGRDMRDVEIWYQMCWFLNELEG